VGLDIPRQRAHRRCGLRAGPYAAPREPRRDGLARARRAGGCNYHGGLVLVVYGLTGVEAVGFSSALTVGTLLLAAGLVAAFVFVERSVADPLVPLRVFRSHDLVGAGLVAAALTATTGVTAVLASIYLQGVLGYPPALAGLAGLPFSISVIAGSFAGARLIGRVGARATMASGLVGVAVAGLITAGIWAEGGVTFVLTGAALSGLSLWAAPRWPPRPAGPRRQVRGRGDSPRAS
jgi:hypothetical protein